MTMRAKRYQNSAALLIFMRRTTIPNSSFLIPHSRKAFIHNQWTEPPHELTLIPKETLIKSQSQILQEFLYIASS